MKTTLLLGLFFTLGLIETSHAQVATNPTPTVIYWGGTGANSTDMANWESSARQQCGSRYYFKAIPYRAGLDYHRGPAIKAAAPDIAALKRLILSNPNQKYIIGCHSSGCAGADELAEQLIADKKFANNVTELNNLEGFRPSPQLQKRIPTNCWSAKNNGLKYPVKGRNWNSMAMCERHRVILNNSSSCQSEICLHYGLANRGATDQLRNPRDARFRAGVAWLPGCDGPSASPIAKPRVASPVTGRH